jgi:hypothetical protein
MYSVFLTMIGRNASQTHVLFCDFFKQLIWKSFRNITEVCEIIKYRHINEPCYISLTLYHDRFSIPVSAGDVIGKGESANNDARKWPILPFDVSRDFIISNEILV